MEDTTATYTYDATNRMVSGTNDIGEQSNYTFNGLDVLVEQTWVIDKNNYGYTSNSTGEIQSDSAAEFSDIPVSDLEAANAQPEGVPTGRVTIYIDGDTGDLMGAEGVTYQTLGNSQTSIITKSFVIDYTSETQNPLMEYESTGLTYRYVYGNQRLSVDINGVTNGAGSIIESNGHIRLYYHQDYLGTTDYLTSPVSKKVLSWTHYNEWGEITHNAILKCGQRELDLVKNYTGYEYDAVLDQFYAKYRMYDAGDRRFTATDPIRDGLNWYIYVENNPVMWTDPLGLKANISMTAKVKTTTIGGVEYAAIEDLVEAYNSSFVQDKDNSSIYTAKIGDVVLTMDSVSGSLTFTKSYTTSEAVYLKKDDFINTTVEYKKGIAYVTQSKQVSNDPINGEMINKGNTNYMTPEYFQKIMCALGNTKELVRKDSLAENIEAIKKSITGLALLKGTKTTSEQREILFSYSTPEILARLIYQEHKSDFVAQEQIMWTIINRVFSGKNFYRGGDMTYNLRNFITGYKQYSSVYYDEENSINAYRPDTTSKGWENAMLLASYAYALLGETVYTDLDEDYVRDTLSTLTNINGDVLNNQVGKRDSFMLEDAYISQGYNSSGKGDGIKIGNDKNVVYFTYGD